MKALEKELSKTLSVTEFKAHCTEELLLIEKTGERIAITRHGKTIAYLEAAEKKDPTTIADLMGSMNGWLTYEKESDLEDPIPYDDWVMHHGETEQLQQ